jgi:small conductance mechanosensitive channel
LLSNVIYAAKFFSASEKTIRDVAAATNQIQTDIKTGAFQQWLDSIVPKALSFFWCVVLALIVWFVGARIINFIRKIMRKAMERRDVEEGVKQFTDSILKAVLYIALIAVILSLFGIETSSFAAAIASVGVTAGLAFQGSLSNLAGGILILVLHPFKVGDYIIEDTHKNEGTVTEISIFYTKLLTTDRKVIVIPNGTLANSSLTNVTDSEHRLLDLEFSIGYDDDIKKAKDILMNLSESENRRKEGTEISVFVKNLGQSAVVLGLRMEIPQENYWNVRYDMLENVKYAFDKEGISIPFPQLEVHNKNDQK